MQWYYGKSTARFAACTLALACCTSVSAQSPVETPRDLFPGEAVDSRTLDTRRQVEELYATGAFQRALLIYEKELAPIGDKYAQYMVGYMHLTGQGVAKDNAVALAWFRLAAERGESPLVKARDALSRKLGPAELERANDRFLELWQQYGDRKLLLELIAEDLTILRERGSAGESEARPGAAIVAGYFGNEGSEGYYRRVRERLDRRMQYLESTNRLEDVSRLSDSRALQHRETDIRRAFEALNLR
jgi:TPR repeat protein